MAKLDYDTFIKKEFKQGAGSFEQRDFKVSYFSLANDGDEAIVRFIYSSEAEFDIETVHVVEVEGKQRRVSCLRTGLEPLHMCPLCESGYRVYDKMYVKLIQYVPNDKGQIVAQGKVWERPAYFAKKIKALFKEYGDVSDVIFKVVRHGKKGDTKTYYDILFANPMVYKPEIYIKDFSAFKDFELNKVFFMEKTATEMREFIATGKFPVTKSAQTISQEVSINKQPTYTIYQQEPVQPVATQPITTAPVQPVVTPQVTVHQTTSQTTSQELDPTANRPRRYTY